jgi:hypothetical protein
MKRSISTFAVSLVLVVLAHADETAPPPLADNADESIRSVPLVRHGGRRVGVGEDDSEIARASMNEPAELLPPPKRSEPLTPPRVLEEPVLPHAGLDQAYFRQSRMDVWQNYAVDHSGHWRPRVIYSPSGAYYRYNGQPFPWAEVHGLEFMPYVGE